MTKYGVLTDLEFEAARSLESEGWQYAAAVAAVVCVTRRVSRPNEGFIEWLRGFPQLETRESCSLVFGHLMRENLLQMAPPQLGIVNLKANNKLVELVGIHLARASSKVAPQEDPDPISLRIGRAISTPESYSSYLSLILHSRREVLVVGFRPSPASSAAKALKERARNGVRVRVILASQDQIEELWGKTSRIAFADYEAGWRVVASGTPNFEIRISSDISFMKLGSSCMVDGQSLSMSVFDYKSQIPMDGIAFEVVASRGTLPNLIEIYRQLFERAWVAARHTGLSYRFRHILAQWRWGCSIAFGVAAAWLSMNVVVSAILASVSAAFAFSGLLDLGEDLIAARRSKIDRKSHTPSAN